MLVLTRKSQQSIVINGNVKVTVVRIDRNQVRIGIEAPPEVAILREELQAIDSPTREAARATELPLAV